MDAKANETANDSAGNATTSERVSDRELMVTRSVNGPARLVFDAWTKPELMKQWWVPKSYGISLLSCEMDVRTGGSYRFLFANPAGGEPMAFFGRYLEVVPQARLVWTNEESGPDGSVTTVTFEQRGAATLIVLRDLYPSKAALDEAIATGAPGAFGEQFEQLDALLAA